jgi:carbonic anhydrase
LAVVDRDVAVIDLCPANGRDEGGARSSRGRSTVPATQLSTLFERNAEFVRSGAEARRHVPELPFLPWQHAYVITCIDPRTDPAVFFGVGVGDAIVARTVGGRVTPAVLQDLAYIGYLVETKAPAGPFFEVAVVHHTDCGSGLLADDELRHGFAARTGYADEVLKALPVLDPAETVRADVALLLEDPRISREVTVSGHVYDTATGQVTTVVEPAAPRPRGRG